MVKLLGYACALALAGVFVWAAVAKLVRLEETRKAFAAMGVPKSATAARVVPALELVLAAVLVSVPQTGGAMAFGSLGAFNVLLVRAIRSGANTPCNCFGSRRADPISKRDLFRNLGLMTLAVPAALLA